MVSKEVGDFIRNATNAVKNFAVVSASVTADVAKKISPERKNK